MLIIRELVAGSETFNDLRRGLPLISPSLLSSRLKSLEAAGVIDRSSSGDRIRYTLTDAGEELRPIILQIGYWGHRWARSNLSRDDLDPSLLMWDIHRTMDVAYFGDDRTVIYFEFSDFKARSRRWWLVIEKGEVDVCLKDPGHKIDLEILTNVRTLTAVRLGDMELGKAVREGTIELNGPQKMVQDVTKWFSRNPYAESA